MLFVITISIISYILLFLAVFNTIQYKRARLTFSSLCNVMSLWDIEVVKDEVGISNCFEAEYLAKILFLVSWFGKFICFSQKIDLRLSRFLHHLTRYLGNEKSYRRSAGVKTTRFLRAFWISWFLDFWIFEFLDFFLFPAISRQRKELQVTFWCQND